MEQDLLTRSQMTGLLFIRSELSFLHTLLDCAELALTANRRDQSLADAEKAFQTVRRILPRLEVDEKEVADLRQQFGHLAKRYRRIRLTVVEQRPQ